MPGRYLDIKKCNHCNHIIEYIENKRSSVRRISIYTVFIDCLELLSTSIYPLKKWVTGLHLDSPGCS